MMEQILKQIQSAMPESVAKCLEGNVERSKALILDAFSDLHQGAAMNWKHAQQAMSVKTPDEFGRVVQDVSKEQMEFVAEKMSKNTKLMQEGLEHFAQQSKELVGNMKTISDDLIQKGSAGGKQVFESMTAGATAESAKGRSKSR